MAACLGVPVDLILPCGFDVSDRAFRRAGMDYLDALQLRRHADWSEFEARREEIGTPRLVLLTTRAALRYSEFEYRGNDILLVGRESSGVPDGVHDVVDASVRIPMRAQLRSLNVAAAAAIVLSEGLRQTGGLVDLV